MCRVRFMSSISMGSRVSTAGSGAGSTRDFGKIRARRQWWTPGPRAAVRAVRHRAQPMNPQNSPRSELPLTGIRVIDFTTLLPGPLATLMLKRAGAEVIKIEPPGGDPMRTLLNDGGAAFELLNAGKRSVVADLKRDEERAAILALCRDADVVIEQFRPGVMDRLGLGYAALAADVPSIVYTSITGYGQHGANRTLAGHDINYLAESGLFSLFSAEDGAPWVPPVLLADVVGGAYPAFSNTLLALLRLWRHGKGAYVDIAMTRGLQALSVSAVAGHVADVSSAAATPLDGSRANYRCYRCADGAWLAIGALEAKFWSRLCELIGVEHRLRRCDPSDSDVVAELDATFRTRPLNDWLALFEGQDVCCSGVRSLPDVLQELAVDATRNLPLPLAPCFDRAVGEAPSPGEGNLEFLGGVSNGGAR
ncbi:MAG: CoA transferase [Proteobacteria bacterium]|nr:MAG: CoA transferase [Pseudomonadota bacterium]